MKQVFAALGALVAFGAASQAAAHAVLEDRTAAAGSFHKVVLYVTHGCEGTATTSVRVRIPVDVRQAKPRPEPGWNVELSVRKLEQPYDWYGHRVSEDVREIRWHGGSLPDSHFQEFVFFVKLPDAAGSTVYFPTIQTCESGEHHWTEVPSDGEGTARPDNPAPSLRLVPGSHDTH